MKKLITAIMIISCLSTIPSIAFAQAKAHAAETFWQILKGYFVKTTPKAATKASKGATEPIISGSGVAKDLRGAVVGSAATGAAIDPAKKALFGDPEEAKRKAEHDELMKAVMELRKKDAEGKPVNKD